MVNDIGCNFSPVFSLDFSTLYFLQTEVFKAHKQANKLMAYKMVSFTRTIFSKRYKRL